MKKRKTILYIHHGKGIGGAPLSLLYLIKHLDRTKYYPVVLFLYDSEVIGLYQREGITTVGPINKHDFSHTRIWWYRWYHPHHVIKAMYGVLWTLCDGARHHYRTIKPDFVHLNTSSLSAWLVVASWMKIPVINHVREPLASGYFGIRRYIIKKLIGRCASTIIPICHNDARPWQYLDKTHVVYNPVDLKRFDYRKYDIAPAQCPTILFVGGLSQEKGMLFILTVIKELKKYIPDVVLRVAGYCDLAEKHWLSPRRYTSFHRFKHDVKLLLAELGDCVQLLGAISTVPQEMKRAHVVVFPATVGHFARPIIEAGCMKRPVVASKLPPLDELVRDGETGFLCEAGNVPEWVAALRQLLSDDTLREKMGTAAHRQATVRFDAQEIARQVQKYYEQAASS